MEFIKLSTFLLVVLTINFMFEKGQTQSGEPQYCIRKAPIQFFNLATKQGAVATGLIRGHGYLFFQDHTTWCDSELNREFRTYDGTCNHPANLGASFKPVRRLLQPEYDNGVDLPRTKGVGGVPLPSAREVSKTVHPPIPNLRNLTLMVMQWGQWVDHDITGLPVASEFDSGIKCCGPNGTSPSYITDKNCFPIELPASENNFIGQCMEFVRSIPAVDDYGRYIVPREQVNSLTSFIDASQIYGSTTERAALLRAPGYLMKTRGNFLPESEEDDCIKRQGSLDHCFVAGDIRVNEQPALAAMHTIWMREHNRIATFLRAVRPQDTQEVTFQKARKIIGALQQVITYNEWLPIILGNDVRQARLLSSAGRTLYNPALDPRVFNAFSSAAMRFGHSMIPDVFPIGNRRVPLRELFNRVAEVIDNLDLLVEGIAGAGSPGQRNLQDVDRNFVSEITEHLFEPEESPHGRGLDLVALNIQRGRDHGLPPYTKFRAFCGLRKLIGFDDVEALGVEGWRLGNVYRTVDDIDLFTGMVHEPVEPRETGLAGPTLRCLLRAQFFNLKFGDRFFFDTFEPFSSFTRDQIDALRNVTLAKVICHNTNINSLPLDVFQFPSIDNPRFSCSQLSQEGLDVTLWA